MPNNTFRREPIQYKQLTDDSRLFHINQFKGLQILDNPLAADYNSCYYCKNVYKNDTGTLTVRPRLELDPFYLNINESLEILDYWYFDKIDTLFWYTNAALVASKNGQIITTLVIDGLQGCTMEIFEQTPYFLVIANNVLTFYKFTTNFSIVEPPKQNLPVVGEVDPAIADYNILTERIIEISQKPFEFYPKTMKPEDRLEQTANTSFTNNFNITSGSLSSITGSIEIGIINDYITVIMELGTTIKITLKGYDKSTRSFITSVYDIGLISKLNQYDLATDWVGKEHDILPLKNDTTQNYPYYYYANYKVQNNPTLSGGNLVFLFGNIYGTQFKRISISYGLSTDLYFSSAENVISSMLTKNFNRPYTGPGLDFITGNWSKTNWHGPFEDWWAETGNGWGKGPWHYTKEGTISNATWNGRKWSQVGVTFGPPAGNIQYGQTSNADTSQHVLPQISLNEYLGKYNSTSHNTSFAGIINSDLAVFLRPAPLGSLDPTTGVVLLGEKDITCDLYSFSENKIVSSFYLYKEGTSTPLQYKNSIMRPKVTSFVCGMLASDNVFMLRTGIEYYIDLGGSTVENKYYKTETDYYYTFYHINNYTVKSIYKVKVFDRHFYRFRGQWNDFRVTINKAGIVTDGFELVSNETYQFDAKTAYFIGNNVPNNMFKLNIDNGIIERPRYGLSLVDRVLSYEGALSTNQILISNNGDPTTHYVWERDDPSTSRITANKLAQIVKYNIEIKQYYPTQLQDDMIEIYVVGNTNIFANEETLVRTETRRPNDVVPYLSKLSSEVITSMFLDGFYWFITKDYIFGTGRGTIEFWDFAKYFKLNKPAIAAMRISDTSFWVFHNEGAYLIFKDTSSDIDSYGRGIWRITETAKAKPCHFKNAVVTLPISSYIATVTPDDISVIQLRKYVQSDERVLVPITFKISALIREIIQNSYDVKIASYKYLTLFAFNQDNKCDILVFDNQTQDWWLWNVPFDKVYQMKTTNTNIEILFKTDSNVYKIYNFNEYEFRYNLGIRKFNIYADCLAEKNVYENLSLIDWSWESALQTFGTLDLRKQLLKTNFTFTDFGEESNTGVEYNFNVFRRKFIKTDNVDSKTSVQMAKNRYNRTYITTFNFLQLNLANLKLEDHLELGEKLQLMVKPNLASINFVYRLLPGIGPV